MSRRWPKDATLTSWGGTGPITDLTITEPYGDGGCTTQASGAGTWGVIGMQIAFGAIDRGVDGSPCRRARAGGVLCRAELVERKWRSVRNPWRPGAGRAIIPPPAQLTAAVKVPPLSSLTRWSVPPGQRFGTRMEPS